MQALRFASVPGGSEYELDKLLTVGIPREIDTEVKVTIDWDLNGQEVSTESGVREDRAYGSPSNIRTLAGIDSKQLAWRALKRFRVFSFDAKAIASAVDTAPNPRLGEDGSNLAAILDALRDTHPEKFEELNNEFHRWLPEFDRILFDIPDRGKKTFLGSYLCRTSQITGVRAFSGSSFCLGVSGLSILARAAVYRWFRRARSRYSLPFADGYSGCNVPISLPENYGETRQPAQVIATTHSPYLLDLYKEHPEQIVISHKDEHGVHFERLSDKPHLNEILEGAPLGDIWLTGILGGIPSAP